jgi:drug/metabolite transporter (DMT)-like permease
LNLASLIRLIALSAIWGGSFLFMRIGVPILGPVVLIWSRLALAALFLSVVGVILRKRLEVREHWRHFVVLGLINSALPFLLFGTAARTLSASLLSILNATAPIWAAVIGAVWSKTPLTRKGAAGLFLGVIGVGVLVGFDPSVLHVGAYGAVAMSLLGALFYGVSSTYARTARQVDPFANAHGSMWAATLLLTPAVPFFAHSAPVSPLLIVSVVALGVLCSGVAYLLYFRLIADIGPPSALTVTFLVPVFGVVWGHLFLHEPVGLATLAGAAIVIAGTALVTGFSLPALLAKRSTGP